MTEDEVAGWHHQLDGHEFEQALVVGDRQGSLVCCSPWSHKEWTRLCNRTTATVNSAKWTVSVQFSRSVVSDSATP